LAEYIVPVPAPDISSSEEEDGVVVKVEPGGIYRGVTLERQDKGGRGAYAVVKLEGGDQGSLHVLNCEERQLPAPKTIVWVKVLRIEEGGRKIVLSTKNIDQETGKLKIALDAAGEPICAGKLDESEWGRSTEPGRRGKPKGGRVYLAEALGDGFTDSELAQVFVVSKKAPGKISKLLCATRNGTRLTGVPAIRKYLKDQRDACKAKRRRVESDGSAGPDAGDDDEEATWERAMAMAMEEEPASLG